MRCGSTRHVLLAVLCLLFLQAGLRLSAKGAEEQSQARAEYLSERGIVLPVHEVRVEELLSAFDFQYSEPEGDFGIRLYAANNLLPVSGGEQVIMIGVQGRRTDREARAPIDIVLAVDRSGSMGEPDKLEWAKDSLEVLIDALRDDDRVCLTTFEELLSEPTPGAHLLTAAARGLTLEKVFYRPSPRLQPTEVKSP